MNLLKEYESIDRSWKDASELNIEELLHSIRSKIKDKSEGQLIFPREEHIFRCLRENKLDDVKVVVVGQDPYHQYQEIDGQINPQAMGLAFSVPRHIKTPPSLKNIYKELSNSFEEYVIPDHGDISEWSGRGVLLLNTSLTVEYDKPNIHAKTGWSDFTSDVIKKLSDREKPLVFLSWGKNAHAVTKIAENTHHKVIKTSHPSPLGARKSGEDFISFLGSACFREANFFLIDSNQEPIDWSVT